jgi:hypothetical protein
MFAPVGFFSKSSGIERYFALAATSFAFAFSEAPNDATVTAWFMLPDPKSLPGTTTMSLLLVFLFILLRLTEMR